MRKKGTKNKFYSLEFKISVIIIRITSSIHANYSAT